tara:strand:+ start:166 stop:1440 length:1275 start_codon:yes stop_codon:yes gene_type:complete
MIYLINFILIITVLVFFHELGHYLAARSVGVKVEKFYIGFNLFGLGIKKKFNETEYGIGLFPLGGYVKVAGVVDESLDDSEKEEIINDYDYRSKNTIQKIWIMSAGVLMNIIVAIFIFSSIAMTIGTDIGLRVISIKDNPPAASIGIEPGDSISLVNGVNIIDHASLVKVLDSIAPEILNNVPISYFDYSDNIIRDKTIDLSKNKRLGIIIDSTTSVVESVILNPFINSNLEENQIIYSINRKQVKSKWDLDKNMALDFKELNLGSNKIIIDRNINNIEVPITYFLDLEVARGEKLGPISAVKYGIENTINMLKKMISGISDLSKDNIGGPLMIAKVSGEVAKQSGFEGIMIFMAMLSLNLAILNMLPIPGLDGFHIFIATIEGLLGREISNDWKIKIQVAGMLFLFSIFAYVLWNDISRIFSS